MKKTKVKMNKLVHLGMSILDNISKTLMYGFWYDYIKQKYQDKAKLCDMDTSSLIDDAIKKKKAKGTKKCEIEIKAKFNNYKNCQSNNEIILQPQLK